MSARSIAVAVGIGEDVFIDGAGVGEEVVEEEVGAFGEEPAALEQRRDLALVAFDEMLIGPLIVAGALVLHAVFFSEALDLAVSEHRQAGQRGHQGGDAEALVALAKLINRRALIGIAHEVDVALHDVGIEFEGVLDNRAVVGVVFVAEHDHEGAVIDAVHAEGAYEVAFHEPEGLGEEQGAGNFGGDAIDDFAPEFVGHEAVEFLLVHAVFSTRGDGAAGAGTGEPEAMEVALGERHGGVEADDWERGARRGGWSG